MTNVTVAEISVTAPVTTPPAHADSNDRPAPAPSPTAAAPDGCRADPFASAAPPRQGRQLRLNSSYGMSAFVGVVTYLAYGSLNYAWGNWVLFAVALYMFLSIPLYSKLSNKCELAVARRTQLETLGRVARYVLQLLVNLALLWVFVEGQVIDPSGLDGIGGFFATAAWITIVSQGGQYLANWLARRHVGDSDRNVVLAVSISAMVNALAVSGVTWVQPIYIILSLSFGALIFGAGVVSDTRLLSGRTQA